MNGSHWLVMTLAAAAAALGATTASAQTLEAQVPFSFTVGSQRVLQPGTYTLRHEPNVWYIRGYDTHETVLAVPTGATQNMRKEPAMLVFHCRTAVCNLYAIEKSGAGAVFAEPKQRKTDGNEFARVVVVPLKSSNAD